MAAEKQTVEIQSLTDEPAPQTQPQTTNTDDKTPTDEATTLDTLQRQLEFYFSTENLKNDAYLLSKMDQHKFVPIDVICKFGKVLQTTTSRDLVLKAMKRSKALHVDEDEQKVRPNLKLERTCIILRDIPSTTDEAVVKALFGEQASKIQNVRADIGDTWFVSFSSENETIDACMHVRAQKFQDKSVHARIKSETMLRSFFTQTPGQQANKKQAKPEPNEMAASSAAAVQAQQAQMAQMTAQGQQVPFGFYPGHVWTPRGFYPIAAFPPTQQKAIIEQQQMWFAQQQQQQQMQAQQRKKGKKARGQNGDKKKKTRKTKDSSANSTKGAGRRDKSASQSPSPEVSSEEQFPSLSPTKQAEAPEYTSAPPSEPGFKGQSFQQYSKDQMLDIIAKYANNVKPAHIPSTLTDQKFGDIVFRKQPLTKTVLHEPIPIVIPASPSPMLSFRVSPDIPDFDLSSNSQLPPQFLAASGGAGLAVHTAGTHAPRQKLSAGQQPKTGKRKKKTAAKSSSRKSPSPSASSSSSSSRSDKPRQQAKKSPTAAAPSKWASLASKPATELAQQQMKLAREQKARGPASAQQAKTDGSADDEAKDDDRRKSRAKRSGRNGDVNKSKRTPAATKPGDTIDDKPASSPTAVASKSTEPSWSDLVAKKQAHAAVMAAKQKELEESKQESSQTIGH